MIAWFTRNGVAANLLMLVIAMGGITAMFTIDIKFFPEIKLDAVSISVLYAGAAPEEVERSVVKPIEDALEGIIGVKRIKSTAAENIGSVICELEAGENVQKVKEEVKSRVDRITSLPSEAEKPVVEEILFNEDVLLVAVHGQSDELTLKRVAESVREDLLRIDGISSLKMIGVRDYEITIEVTQESLERYELDFDEVVAAIRNASLDLPGGTVRSAGGEILLRTRQQRYRAEEFGELMLRSSAGGSRLLLRDVATLRDGFVDEEMTTEFDGEPAALMSLYAVGKETPFDISTKTHEYVERTQAEMPAGIKLTIIGDGSYYLKGRLNMMMKNGGFGLLLVFAVLALFLRPTLALFVALGIPISFLGTLFVMPYLGLNINMLSLFAFILVLGIVVDDAIVVGESVFTEIRRNGPGTESAIRGAHLVAMPVTFAILTSVVAFIPLVVVPGVTRAFFAAIGLVVMSTLLWSLVQSKLVLPYHLSLCKVGEGKGMLSRAQVAVANGLERFIDAVYRPILALSLRYRYLTLLCFFAVLALSVVTITTQRVKFVDFPSIPSDYILTQVEMPIGTPASETGAVVKDMQARLRETNQAYMDEGKQNSIDHVSSVVGAQVGGTAGSHLAFLVVELPKMEGRDVPATTFSDRWREAIGVVPGMKSLQMIATAKLDENKPFEFQLVGEDFDELIAATSEIKAKLAEYEGVFDITDNYSEGKRELLIHVKPEAEQLGVSAASVARQVRNAFHGAEAQRLIRGREEIKVMVRYPREQRQSVGHLERMRIRTASGVAIPFTEVASLEPAQGAPVILRSDQDRAVKITADANRDVANVVDLNNVLSKTEIPAILERYPGVTVSLEGEAKNNAELFDSIKLNALLALFVIYILLAIPLKSYLQPLIVMSVIPFGLVGAVFGHYVTGQDLSLLSTFGLVALTGVVVNDSLVLVDYINRENQRGNPPLASVWEAGARRFRPILLTSLTTFVGLVPILLERSLQAQIVIPMATSLAFGVLFATAITLFLVPALYLILNDAQRLTGFKE